MTRKVGMRGTTQVGAARRLSGALFAAAIYACGMIPQPAAADGSAVIFMYHRIGEDAFPATSVRLEQFEAHVQELQKPKYNVMAVPDILEALRKGRDLPDRTIGITIDDAFKSVYVEAWPRLKAAGFPFTLFVSTGPVDRGLAGYMTWDQIREMAAGNVTIGNHTVTHLHMPRFAMKRNISEMRVSNARLNKELGVTPKIFAFPYGETSAAITAEVKKAGFEVAFGQHSGVLYAGADMMYLPRFALNQNYGNIERFRLAANALPIRVTDITPRDVLLSPKTNPPKFGFTVEGDAIAELKKLACYASGQGKARLIRLGERRIETRMERAFPTGRARINCTLPSRGGRWRWFGTQFYVPPPAP